MKVMKKAALMGAAAIAATVGIVPAAHAASNCTYSDNGSYYFCATLTYNRNIDSETIVITVLSAPSTTDFHWTNSYNGDNGYVNSNSGQQFVDAIDGYHPLILRLNESKYGPGSLSLH